MKSRRKRRIVLASARDGPVLAQHPELNVETLSFHATIILAIIVLSYIYKSIVHVLYNRVSSAEWRAHQLRCFARRLAPSLVYPKNKTGLDKNPSVPAPFAVKIE